MADDKRAELEKLLELQRSSFTASRPEPMSMRKDRIKRAMALLKDHGESLCKAMSADFGNRSIQQSMVTDIAGTIGAGKSALGPNSCSFSSFLQQIWTTRRRGFWRRE